MYDSLKHQTLTILSECQGLHYATASNLKPQTASRATKPQTRRRRNKPQTRRRRNKPQTILSLRDVIPLAVSQTGIKMPAYYLSVPDGTEYVQVIAAGKVPEGLPNF